MISRLFGVALATSVFAAAPAMALLPSGKWVLDGTPGGCLLTRDFGEGANKLTFGIKRVPLSQKMVLVLLSPTKLAVKRSVGHLDAVFPSGSWSGTFASLQMADGRWIQAADLPDDNFDIVTRAANARLTFDKSAEVQLEGLAAASIGPAMAMCRAKVLEHWGVDPKALDTVATEPKPARDPSSWIINDDYPQDALRKGEQGIATILWSIGDDGKTSNCRVVESSGSASLDHASCSAILRRGRYRPALDKNGKPISTVRSQRVRFMIP